MANAIGFLDLNLMVSMSSSLLDGEDEQLLTDEAVVFRISWIYLEMGTSAVHSWMNDRPFASFPTANPVVDSVCTVPAVVADGPSRVR